MEGLSIGELPRLETGQYVLSVLAGSNPVPSAVRYGRRFVAKSIVNPFGVVLWYLTTVVDTVEFVIDPD